MSTEVKNEHNMIYNSQREHLTIPEYGRNIQNMVRFAKSIEKDEERQSFIDQVANLMMQLTPHSKSFEDTLSRVWSHVFRIADFDLNVTPPEGVVINLEQNQMRPQKLEYPISTPRYRHYGHYVQVLIKKALEMEDEEKREGFVDAIGSYMKLAYRTWNKEHYISDEIIINDLVNLSNGELEMHDDVSLDNLKNQVPTTRRGGGPRSRSQGHGGRRSNNNRSNSGGRNSNNNRRRSKR